MGTQTNPQNTHTKKKIIWRMMWGIDEDKCIFHNYWSKKKQCSKNYYMSRCEKLERQ
jgi:hypothetical protein